MIDLSIRNIIFDLGGVILDIDFSKTTQAFRELGIEHFDKLFSQLHASDLFTLLEQGKIDSENFCRALNAETGLQIPSSDIINAWNALLLNFPPERIRLLKALKNDYRCFLLSNTNAIHLERFLEMYVETTGEGSLDDCFEKTYYSHSIGFRKPNKEAYQLVLKDNNLVPEQTLFIDDTLPNVEAARSLGIQSIHLQSPETILTVFSEYASKE